MSVETHEEFTGQFVCLCLECCAQVQEVLQKVKDIISYGGDSEDIMKKSLLVELISLQCELITSVATLVKKESYFCGSILLSALIENVILASWITDDKYHLAHYFISSKIEDLQRINEKTSNDIKQIILDALKSHKELINQKMVKKGVQLVTDEDYLNRNNYKKKVMPSIKEISETLKRKGNKFLYKGYQIFCDYKHFNARRAMVSSISSFPLTVFDPKLYRQMVSDIFSVLFWLNFCMLNLIKFVECIACCDSDKLKEWSNVFYRHNDIITEEIRQNQKSEKM